MADIVIHGAGIFGLSVAWESLSRGASVVVVDPNGVAAGASGGLVGALAPHTPENWNDKKQLQFDSLERAETLWAEVAEVSGRDPGYARSGRLQPVMDDRALELAQARAAQARNLWRGRYRWEVITDDDAPIRAPTGRLIRDSLSARLHPRNATRALADAVRARGGRIMDRAGAETGVHVLATGAAGLEAISAEVGATIGNGVKGQAALLDCDLATMPQLFVDGLHIVPHRDGTVAIGSTSERDYDTPTGTDAQLDGLIDKARRWCPALRDAPVIERWAGLRPRARSRAPMIGAHPTKPGAFIANGGFKIGFGMAPICARLLVDLVLEGRDAIPDSFRPDASLPR
jgi:glycine oxidase